MIKIRKALLNLMVIVIFISCNSDFKNQEKALNEPKWTFKPASSFFDIPKAKLLLVGTFHFDYPGLDAYKAADIDKVDVLNDLRQKEVQELAEYIEKFKPNKIAIEVTNSRNASEKLRAYKKGEYRNERGEIYQLAMRIATDLELDTLYAIDAVTLDSELKNRFPEFRDSIWGDFNWRGESKIDSLYRKWRDYTTRLEKEQTLLEGFKYSNCAESMNYTFSANLSGDFALEGYTGADVMSIYWFNRNLRTVRNIQEITENEDDRILVLMGAGHIAMLKQFFTASPQYEVVDFNSL